MTVREAFYALLGADVLVRAAVATALQLGIASGVGLMLVMQSKIAERDDREAAWNIARQADVDGGFRVRSSSWPCTSAVG